MCYKIIIECGKKCVGAKEDYLDYFRKKKKSAVSQIPDSQTLVVISVCCPQGAVWVKNLTVHQRLVHISVTEETTAQNNTNYT